VSAVVIGVGPGVGLAVARRFAAGGHAVAVVGRHLDRQRRLLDTAGRSGTSGPRLALAADAADPQQLAAALDEAAERLGPVEVLVYNAVHAAPSLPSVLDPALLAASLAVNVTGALVAAQAVLPGMRAAGRGTILFTGGGLALWPQPGAAALSVGKAGLRALARTMHDELAPAGIHVATITICGRVAPGTAFDPDDIAERYWRLACEPGPDLTWEVVVDGSA
jgi:NAD(P)-dependent dehydrogenase (short-subunit alcohol dehydrogenase family)